MQSFTYKISIVLTTIFWLISGINIVHAHLQNNVTVVITDEGFYPDYIRISDGTTVTWINERKMQHWPASDIHPTHRLYPGSDIGKCGTPEEKTILDACHGLKTGEKFSFTFEKIGKWGIHDHLYPGNTMAIEVGDESSSNSSAGFVDIIRKIFDSIVGFFSKNAYVQLPSSESFRKLTNLEQEKTLSELAKNNPEKAWKYLKETFTINGQVQGNPHQLAHIVGNEIYQKKGFYGISICDPTFAFGCYHGVTEKMLLELGVDAIPKVENSCVKIFHDQLQPAISCIHGIGHGLVTWEGLDIKKALLDCDLLDEQYRSYCYDGVFMEYDFSMQPTINESEPWQFCANLDEKYQPSCAKYQIYVFGRNFNWNFSKIAQSCETRSQLLRDNCLSGLGSLIANTVQGDKNKIDQLCSFTAINESQYSCTISAAIEVIFQEYSKWWETSRELCEELPVKWKDTCLGKINEVIEGYNRQIPSEQPAEIQQIKATDKLDKQVKLYKNLIERVGPEEAQEDLYHSGLPFTGQTHLLNHAVGDYLYEKYGTSGLVKCKEYFLASCYHGFIIHAIGGGLKEVDAVINECNKYGITVSTQCSHALGHGFLAWVGYANLTKALELCEEMTRRVDGFPAFNCRDGVFMENIWGVHSGSPSPDRWIKPNDTFYPCDDPRINPNYLDGCWSNQPSLTYQILQGSITKVGEECLKVTNATYQRTCFNGLSRQIHPLTKGNVSSAFQLCSLLPQEWVNYCVTTVAISDFSVGGRELSFKICAKINETEKENCYNSLYGIMSIYSRSPEEYNTWCKNILEERWRAECKVS